MLPYRLELGPPTSRAFFFPLFINIFLSFSSYLFLFFFSYLLVVLQTCILIYRNTYILIPEKYLFEEKRFLFLSWQKTYSSFWGVFWGGQAFFDSFGVKNVYTGAIMLFFSSNLFLFFSSYLFLFLSYYILPLLTCSYLLILKLFVVLQTCVLNTHWVKVHI